MDGQSHQILIHAKEGQWKQCGIQLWNETIVIIEPFDILHFKKKYLEASHLFQSIIEKV